MTTVATTITAKELREHLSEYLDRAQGGEEIAIIRRSKITARLVPLAQPQQGKGDDYTSNGGAIAAGARKYYQYLSDNKIVPAIDPSKTFKQLYRESMAHNPRYERYVSDKR